MNCGRCTSAIVEYLPFRSFILHMIIFNASFCDARHARIQYDACDENSWEMVGGIYPLSNACGQLGQVSSSLSLLST